MAGVVPPSPAADVGTAITFPLLGPKSFCVCAISGPCVLVWDTLSRGSIYRGVQPPSFAGSTHGEHMRKPQDDFQPKLI